MKSKAQQPWVVLLAVLCGIGGGWYVRSLGTASAMPPRSASIEGRSAKSAAISRQVDSSQPDAFRDGATVEMFASSVPDEVILRFPSEESYGAFLFALGSSKIHLVSQLDRLRAVRLSYDEWSDLADLLDGENLTAYDSLPAVPAPRQSGTSQTGLMGFGDSLLPWLGVTGDHSRWGAGVKIAVLDTGVVPHSALPGVTQSIEIVPFPNDLNKTNGHGTAVASLIGSNHPSAPGIAPAAELISIRVADESGKADSFALAAGILAAMDAGVQIINISMGTTENNPLIEEAVALAHEQHVLIVAASGNSEQAEACYPAAYPSVISVGAVDARGEHLEFSNYGTYLSLTAPGYAINAAWPGNAYAQISGTSASAPIVTAAIAATMSNAGGVTMSASKAAEIVMSQSDEAGMAGPDSEYGVGILNIGRVMHRNQLGIVDAAITDQRVVRASHSGSNDEIQVTLQNRGTTMLVNTRVDVRTSVGSRQFNATTLAPGAIQTFSLSFRLSSLAENEPIEVNSTLTLGGAGQDATPQNNQRSDVLYGR